MNRAGFFNDAPILKPEDDRFGIDRFAQALAKSFKDIESPIGVTIAINGPWGSGKSSAVNLIRYHLKDHVEPKSLRSSTSNVGGFGVRRLSPWPFYKH